MTNELITQGKKYFSDTRLFRYLKLENPLDAYFDNIIVSEKLLSMISIFEIIFRNKVNSVLIERYGNDYLTRNSKTLFNEHENALIERAIKEAQKSQVKIERSRILTELTLGFWCKLASKHILWVQCIHKIHSNKKNIKFKEFIKNVTLINDIRNKIAHHERMIKKRPYSINHVLDVIANETLLLIDDSDIDFKRYIIKYMKKISSDILKIIGEKK